MTARRGIDLDEIVDTAIALVEAEGLAALTLSRVARELGIRPPSLYFHVADLETLRRNVALRATEALGERLCNAAMGRAGGTALRAVAAEFRDYAVTHPGLYELSTRARPDDEEYASAGLRVIEPVIAILRAYDLHDDEAIHAARMLRSALHGFVSLEIADGFGLAVDVDESFEWLVERLVDTLVDSTSPSAGR